MSLDENWTAVFVDGDTVECPSCGATIDCAEQDKVPSNVYVCANCGLTIHRTKEPKWVTDYWKQIPKEWRK